MKKIIKTSDFEEKGRNIVFKEGSKQVLVLSVDDKIFALDNRCPHEGYPLSQGTSDGKDCVLTCNWHNWKFDLKSGKCLIGGDNVRTYPVTIDKDQIIIDLKDPSPEEIRDSIMDGFQVAFEKRQYGRIARELTRLIYNKLDPLYAMKKSILWSYDKFEYGMTHAYAATADWVSTYESSDSEEDKIICLTEAIDHIALDSLRHDIYPFKETDEEYESEKLFNYIVNENSELAEGLVLSGFKGGLRFKDFEKVLSKVALEHYNDFGHSLIYVTKVQELCSYLDDEEVDKALTLSLVRSLSYSTKEDLIPEFKNYAYTLKQVQVKGFGNDDDTKFDDDKLGVNKSYEWLISECSRFKPGALYKEILRINAKNFLQYDLSYQAATHNSVTQNVGWLDFTHAITFSNAVRRTCEKYPELWPQGLVQMISFYGRNSSYTEEIKLSDWKISFEEYKKKSDEILFDHGLGLPIFSAHLIKTSVAALEEAQYFGDDEVSRYLLASMNRFFSSPIKQKHVRRLIHQGINLVSKDFV